MSKITFGYSSRDVRNLLSDKPQEIKALILDLQEAHAVKIRAWYSSDYDGPALRIQIEGELGNLEAAMDAVISKEGLPHIIDQPDPTRFRRVKQMFTFPIY